MIDNENCLFLSVFVEKTKAVFLARLASSEDTAFFIKSDSLLRIVRRFLGAAYLEFTHETRAIQFGLYFLRQSGIQAN